MAKEKNIAKDLKATKSFFENIVDILKQGFNVLPKQKTKAPKILKPVIKKSVVKQSKPCEIAIVEPKFSSPPRVMPMPRPIAQDLPFGYDKDSIALLVRDPWWLYCYWELTQKTKDNLSQSLGSQYHQASLVLRIYDISFINFNGDNAHSYFDISISQEARNWYLNVLSGRSFCVDLGLRLPDGRFIMVLRSNAVTTPSDGPSQVMDEEWFIPEELFQRLYGLSLGAGSSPVKNIKELIEKRFVSSGGLASMASPVKIKQKQRQFWLNVNTELIVYGATEPDAKVTICGRQIKLNNDGAFSVRFALPDSKQVIPVRAESKDGIDERTITPTVTRETR